MNCSDTTALRLLQEARERRFREACGHVPTHGCRHGLYLRANDKSPTQRGNAPMTYAEMIPMLEEGLRIARELAGREADERTNNPKP